MEGFLKVGGHWYDDLQFNNVDDGPDGYFECCDYEGNYLFNFYVDYAGGYPHTTFYGNPRNSIIAYIATGPSWDDQGDLVGYYVKVISVDGKTILDRVLPESPDLKKSSNTWKPYDVDTQGIVFTKVFGNYVELSVKSYDWEIGIERVWGYLDVLTGDFYAPDTITLPLESYPTDAASVINDYDSSKWSKYWATGFDGLYFVKTNDSKWGYVDSNDNIIALYPDASNFSINGYALVTDDGETYYFIDKDFNAYKEYSFDGVSAAIQFKGKNFTIQKADGSTYAVHMNIH